MLVVRCSFAPQLKQAIGSSQPGGIVVADLVETNYALQDTEIYEAAVALAESLENMGKHVTNDVVDEIYKHVVEHVNLSPEAVATADVEDSSTLSESLHTEEQRGTSSAIGGASSSTSAIGGASSSTSAIGGASSSQDGAVRSSAPSAAKEEARDWVIWKMKKSQKWKYSSMSLYFELWRRRLSQKMPARNLFLLEVESVFGPRILDDDDTRPQSVKNGLRLLHEQCRHRFWEVANVDRYDKVAQDLPWEMSRTCTLQELEHEREYLRQWLRSLKTEPHGFEFFEVHDCTVQRVDDDNCRIGKPFVVKQADIVGASHWQHRWLPRPNTIIECFAGGRCVFLSARRSPDMMKMYSYVMTTSISEIRARKVWHIVVGWHYYMHVSVSTESLAETVGSFLVALEHSRINQSVRRLAWGTQLKALGIKGTGSEDGFLSMALNQHFGCQSPEGWHIRTRADKASHWRQADLKREVRLNKMPEWVRENLLDLIGTGRIRLCKSLPLPLEFVMNRKDAKHWHCQQQSLTAKRKRILESGEEQLEPRCLSENLWRQLKLTRQVLPSSARPGKHPR